jgi:large subunit ribosomal protein L29
MKIDTLRDMTKEELLQKREELKDEVFNLNMRKAMKELDNPLKLRTLRRDIAKIETILSEDRLGIRQIVDSPVSILGKGKEERASEDKAKDEK